jgi:5-methylcytosine-specific restriction protein A
VSSSRAFRTADSLESELVTRAAVVPFLRDRGFQLEDHRTQRGTSISQFLVGRDDRGETVTFWVRLCWRKAAGTIEDAHSAAQLLSNVEGDRWIEALEARLDRAIAAGATHLLLVQNAGPNIVRAASLSMAAVLPV